MGRLHLFEWEDQEWFPAFLRNYMTDFLQFVSNKAKVYKGVVPVIAALVKSSGSSRIVDLASGGGGGLLWLNSELVKEIPDLRITLTDYYPNIDAFEYTKRKADNIDYVPDSVDARDVPLNLKGVRTQFLSFHHFKRDDALKILQNAVDSGSAIGVFEVQERNLLSLLAMLFTPITVWLTTPFIRPFSPGRLIFTYLIPIVPLLVMWDGIVSCLRTYSQKEMRELVSELENTTSFDWEIDRIRSGPGVVLYLVGKPQ